MANAQIEEAGATTAPAKKTDTHVNVPGSKLYIIPPAGFAKDTLTSLLEKPSEYGYAANLGHMEMFGMSSADYTHSMKTELQKFSGIWKEEKGRNLTVCRFQSQEGIIRVQSYFNDGHQTAWYSDFLIRKTLLQAMRCLRL